MEKLQFGFTLTVLFAVVTLEAELTFSINTEAVFMFVLLIIGHVCEELLAREGLESSDVVN